MRRGMAALASCDTLMSEAFLSGSCFRPRAGGLNPWSQEEIRRLRELAARGLRVSDIAARLGRSESAIRNKAGLHGVSLRQT